MHVAAWSRNSRRLRSLALLGPLGLGILEHARAAAAQSCDELGLEPERVLYGAGSAALTPLLASLATELEGLPGEERLTLFYADSLSACDALTAWRSQADTAVTLKYWADGGVQATCTAPFDQAEFVHLPFEPTLCAGEEPLATGEGRFPVLVEAIAFITDAGAPDDVISAEAAYHIYGFGAGSYDIAPWNDPETIYRSGVSSWTSARCR